MSEGSFNHIIASLFRYGVRIVSLLLFVGWMANINFSEDVFQNYQTYQNSHLMDDLTMAWSGHKWGLLVAYLGLTILICIPAIRVILVTVVFIRNKEFEMVGVTLMVLLGLILSVLAGIL